MKKLMKFASVAMGGLFALTLLAACGGEGEHKHTFKADWTTSETQHWHEATCGHDVKNALGDHKDVSPKDGKCDDCGYEMAQTPDVPTADKQAPAFTDNAVTLSLDGSKGSTPRRISESLFGVFLEDINYASYLLDDNLVTNGGFEQGTTGWTATKATISQKTGGALPEESFPSVNPNYLQVVAEAGGSVKNGGIAQMPVAVEKGTEYLFSAFVKASAATAMTIRVADTANKVYAEETVSVKQNESWVKYTKTLTATDTASTGLSVTVSFENAGTYGLDGVAFETKDATIGIKQYAYDAIAELSPKFIRFPGGCVIEGRTMVDAYDWKNSIGAVKTGTNAGDDDVPAFTYTLNEEGTEKPVTTYGEAVTRTPNTDIWGYPMEYGLGFYEYFLLCDTLRASAVPVLNCGLSDQGGLGGGTFGPLDGRHGKKINDYIQDAIDLIEFAKGDETTKWGKIRAAMGHKAPFAMDYLGIGNEQSGVYYTDYYEKFLESEAFRAALEKYNVKPIVGNAMHFENCQDPDSNRLGTAQRAAQAYRDKAGSAIDTVAEYGVHDQHYYVNWTELMAHADLYDGYNRPVSEPEDYYEVFVGEYSANEGETRAPGYPLYANSLITALGEAAMMTGMERNGDIVKLAAYAPMFGLSQGQNQWAVDMMYFTNTKILRTINYYVQQMFMQNMGSVVLRSSRLTWSSGQSKTFEFPMENNSSSTPKELNKLYFVASQTDEGDIIVKLVNATGEKIKLNVEIKNAESLGFSYVTKLHADDYKTTNTFERSIVPEKSSIGWEGDKFGYELDAYSVTVFRLLTK